LLVGWVPLVLGWTYLANDEKLSAIGRYIRIPLRTGIDPNCPPLQSPDSVRGIFGSEFAHRDDDRRQRRKIEQLIVDEVSFPGSGIAAISSFLALTPRLGWLTGPVAVIEALLLLILAVEIFVYADRQRGGSKASKAASLSAAGARRRAGAR
jgi:hypothetical protein